MRQQAADFHALPRLFQCRRHLLAALRPDSVSGLGTSWTPHVTLLKTSRLARHHSKTPSPRAAPEPTVGQNSGEHVRANCRDCFGVHELPTLELCAMQGEAAAGFYMVEAALSLSLNHIGEAVGCNTSVEIFNLYYGKYTILGGPLAETEPLCVYVSEIYTILEGQRENMCRHKSVSFHVTW